MEIVKTKGIVIKTLDYQESSKICFLFTKFGKQSFLFTGVKKIKSEKRVLAQIFQKIELSYYSKKTLPRVIDGDIIDSYEKIKCDLIKLDKMAQICDLIYYLSESLTSFDEAYKLLLETLDNLKIYNSDLVFLIFLVNILKFIGYDLSYEVSMKEFLTPFLLKNYEYDLSINETKEAYDYICRFYKNNLEYKIKREF